MTNEEAKEILKRVEIAKPIKFEDYADMREALDMAIKALEQLPCEDTISRKSLSDNLCEGISCNECSFNEIDGESGCLLMKRIDEIPSVQPQMKKGKWIPCSERLPEDNIHVLCQFTLSGMGECYLAHGVFHVVGGLVMTCNEVIAWMPLPKPYEPQESEENNE